MTKATTDERASIETPRSAPLLPVPVVFPPLVLLAPAALFVPVAFELLPVPEAWVAFAPPVAVAPVVAEDVALTPPMGAEDVALTLPVGAEDVALTLLMGAEDVGTAPLTEAEDVTLEGGTIDEENVAGF